MKAAIIGYGKSGETSKKLLEHKGFTHIDIYDDKKENCTKILDYKNIYDITVVSPGVDRSKYKNIPEKVSSEVELAYEIMDKRAKIIGITGTNGKSTTTHLTAQILNNAGIKAKACGNIGYPFGEAVFDKDIEVFVIELSSFQIELLNILQIDAGCIINVSQDHLDRYGLMENYYSAKLKLLHHIKKDGRFVSADDVNIINQSILHKFEAKYIDSKLSAYPMLDKYILRFGVKYSVDINKFLLFGHHNLINLSFALTLADKICDFKGDITYILEGLSSMPHRTEKIGVIKGVTWINDSKATNVDSVYTALKSVSKPATLLIGGRDKKSDYTPLIELINNNVSRICYFGEAASIIETQLSKKLKDVKEEKYLTLKECVKNLSLNVSSGETVLLSPACTSFDEFESYEDRGRKFKEYVLSFTGVENV